MTFRSILMLLLMVGPAQAADFHGVAKSYGKGQCIVLDRLPADSGAKYKSSDADKEQALCGIDFADKGIGMCPKTWSTSPGTVIYDIRKSKYNGSPEKFEAEYCPKQRVLKGKVDGVDRVATFKQSINSQFKQSTSATYAQPPRCTTSILDISIRQWTFQWPSSAPWTRRGTLVASVARVMQSHKVK